MKKGDRVRVTRCRAGLSHTYLGTDGVVVNEEDDMVRVTLNGLQFVRYFYADELTVIEEAK